MPLEFSESDKEVFFGPYSVALDLHKYAVDNYNSVVSMADVTNGFIMELAANCLKFVDCVYVLARLVKEDILENDRKKLNSLVSKVRMMYNQGKAVVKKSQGKQIAFKEFLDKPFQFPSSKNFAHLAASTPTSTRSNTPSLLGSSENEQPGPSRRDSLTSSHASLEEGNCWDPNADEQGNEMYFMDHDDGEASRHTDGEASSQDTWDLQEHIAKIQESEWIPPDHSLPAELLQPHLTCGLCKGYLFNAVTIVECAHFFCKSCILKHIARSLHCPICNLLIHPTDPVANMRHDIVLQDIVYRILPDVEKEEADREKEFYKQRNIPCPKAPKKRPAHNLDQELPYTRLMTVVLDYAGSFDANASYEVLRKRYLRVPDVTTVGTLCSFLRRKLRLSDRHQPYLFCDYHMLHRDLDMATLQQLLFTDEFDEPDLVIIQYGILSARDHWSKLHKTSRAKQQIEDIIKL